MTRRIRFAVLALAVVLAAVAVGPATVSAITATLFTRGTLVEDGNVNNDRIRFKTKDATDVAVQEVTFAPGDSSGWHTHPGFATIAVKSGTLTIYDDDCDGRGVGNGQADVESGGPVLARNEGSQDVTFYVTYVIPTGSPRTESAQAPCPL